MCLIWNEKSKMFGKYIHDIRQHVQIKTTEYSRLQTHSEPCKWQTGISSLAHTICEQLLLHLHDTNENKSKRINKKTK